MVSGRWQRVMPGLYVDPSGRWIANREESATPIWSIRILTRWGLTSSGERFPDYGHIWYGDCSTLSEAKQAVANLGDWMPENDLDLRKAQIDAEYGASR